MTCYRLDSGLAVGHRYNMKHTVIRIAGVLLIISLVAFRMVYDSGIWSGIVNWFGFFNDLERVHTALKTSGWLGALIFIAIQMGQVVLAPIPGDVTGFLGGYLFGAWEGFLLSTIGLTIGSMLNFLIGHFLGERVVRRLVNDETYRKYNEMVQYKGILVIFFFFIVPGFPKDYLCLFLGLTRLPAQVFFVLSTVGRIPGTVALSLQGASCFESNYMVFAVASVSYILFALLAYLTRDPLYRLMARQGKANRREAVLK